MKYFLILFFVSASSAALAQQSGEVKITKFKPPTVKTFLGSHKNGDSVLPGEAAQLLTMPLKIQDDKKTEYEIDSYQFLYRKRGVFENEDNGKKEISSTISSARFFATPLTKIWIDNVGNNLKKDEQLYYFDIVVKDKQGRKFNAPEIKITVL
ncbi:MAG: hypothetical protein ABIP35_01950 [Ginsengibacter sp.]